MTRTLRTLLYALLLLPLGLFAQGVNDAILNSQALYEGTSRSMAMGNATGALGGDATATCINPAGMGLYRAQEFTFTTGLQHALVQSSYYGSSQSDSRMRMTIPSLGVVFAPRFSNYEAVRYIQFGIGLTRINDFNFNSIARGLNPNNSMVDAFLQTVNATTIHTTSALPGRPTYLTNIPTHWEIFIMTVPFLQAMSISKTASVQKGVPTSGPLP